MRLAYRWHRRLGWLLAPFVAISACSGIVLLWLQPPGAHRADPAALQAWVPALDAGLAELRRRHPSAEVDVVELPRGPDGPIRVHLRAAQSQATGWATVDPATRTVGDLHPDHADLRTFVLALHEHLLVEGVGPWLLRAVALCALVLLAMGLRVWWRARRLPARTPWRRWHRRIGPVALLPVAAMLATGFLLRTPELPQALLAGPADAAATAPHAAPPDAADAPIATPGRWLAAAAAALPDARPIRLYAARQGVVRVRLRVDEWNPYGMHHVYLRANDAAVLRVVRAREQPASFRWLDVVYPLHAGWLPGHAPPAVGLAMRALWTAAALSLLALAITGVVQRFTQKAPAAVPRAAPRSP